jgi:hypothetical protein
MASMKPLSNSCGVPVSSIGESETSFDAFEADVMRGNNETLIMPFFDLRVIVMSVPSKKGARC